jgi:hypothetical protein
MSDRGAGSVPDTHRHVPAAGRSTAMNAKTSATIAARAKTNVIELSS